MIDENQLMQIDIIIQKYYKEGQSQDIQPIIEAWQKDVNYFPIAQKVIESTQFSPYFIHFAIVSLEKLIGILYPTWNVEHFLNLSNWCLEMIYNQIDKFFSSDIIPTAFCSMYATIIKYGWHVSSDFHQFFENLKKLFQGNIKHCTAAFILCGYFVEKMTVIHNLETYQLDNFKETTMLESFQYAIQAMSRIYNTPSPDFFYLMKNTLIFTTSCLSFEIFSTQHKMSTDIEKLSISLPEAWHCINFIDVIRLCFEIYKIWTNEEIQRQTLELIFRIISITTKSRTTMPEDQLVYFDTIICCVCEVIESQIHLNENDKYTNVHFLLNILVRFNVSLDFDTIKQLNSFPLYIKCLHQLSTQVLNVDFIVHSTESIVNILKIWGKIVDFIICIDENNAFLNDFLQFISETCQQYLNLLLQLINNENNEFAYELLFSDFSHFNPLIQEFTHVGRILKNKFYDYIFELFNQFLSNFVTTPTIKIYEMNLSLLSLIVASPICIKLQIEEVQSFCCMLLFNLFKSTKDINISGVNCELIERVVIYLIDQLQKSSLIHISIVNSTIPKEIELNTEFKTIDDVLIMLYERLLVTIKIFPNNSQLISSAISTIYYSINNQQKNSFYSNLTRQFLTQELLDINNIQQLTFLANPSNKYSRLMFFKIIFQLIIQDETPLRFKYVFDEIDQRIVKFMNMPDQVQGYLILLDIRGLFMGATTSFHYQFLMEWIFPKLNVLEGIVLNFNNLIHSYLKLLIEISSNTESRIRYEPHSAKGLKLFKTIAESLLKLIPTLPETIHSSFKDITYVMQLMELMLMNNDSYIGALEVYDDPILKNLFAVFLQYTNKVNFLELSHYQKATSVLLNFLNCLYERFIEYVVQIDINFINTSLIICSLADPEARTVDVDKAFNVIFYITEFYIRNENNDLGKALLSCTHETYDKVLIMLEKMIYKFVGLNPSSIRVASLMKSILRMRPNSWNEVKLRLALFLQNCKNPELEKKIKQLLSIQY